MSTTGLIGRSLVALLLGMRRPSKLVWTSPNLLIPLLAAHMWRTGPRWSRPSSRRMRTCSLMLCHPIKKVLLAFST